MKKIALVALILFFLEPTFAQTYPSEVKVYNVKIYFYGYKKPIKGTFFTYSDSTITIINTKSKTAISSGSYKIVDYSINEITELRVRRKGKIVSTAMIGGLICGSTGALIGLASGDDEPGLLSFTAEEKAGLIGVPFFVIGSGIGAIAGCSYSVISIEGESESIVLNQKKLDKYSIIKPERNAFH